MGSCFGNTDTDFDHEELVEETEDGKDFTSKVRKPTDSFFIYFMSVFVVLAAILLGLASQYSNIDRVLHGVDDCGNICGKKNDDLPKNLSPCVGQDMTKFPYLNITLVHIGNMVFVESKKCVAKCAALLNPDECVIAPTVDGFLEAIGYSLHHAKGSIITSVFTALGLTAVLILLMKYFMDVFVWIIIATTMTLLSILTLISWISTANLATGDTFDSASLTITMSMAIVLSIFTLVFGCVLLLMRHKLALIIQLFKETNKAISVMPLIFIQPTISFIFMMFFFAGFAYFLLLLVSAGELTQVDGTHFEYTPNGIIIGAFVFVTFASIWIINFIFGSQQMVVGGAVASWYFARNKATLKAPIYKSNYNMFKYHLGSVAFGSMILTIIKCMKIMIRMICRNSNNSNAAALCLRCIALQCFEAIYVVIRYLSQNAYIMTAMHGYPFCTAGKKAFNLLVENGLTTIAINSIGNFILGCAKLVVIIVNVLITYAFLEDKENMQNVISTLLFVFIMTSFIVHCFVVVYQMAIDTIFLCFCEDSLENDGITKPYYMSMDLRNYVEGAKKMFAVSSRNFMLGAPTNTSTTSAVA